MVTQRSAHALDQAAALSTFANPARSRIMDLLAAHGPATASVVAERLGMAVGSASHHLKVLAEAGLVTEAEGISTDRRQRFWQLAHEQVRWARSEMTEPSARTAAFQAEVVSLERQFDRAREALRSSEDAGDVTGAFATQQWLTLTADELGELSQEIVDVLHRWRHREIPEDGADRSSCFVFARGFPAAP